MTKKLVSDFSVTPFPLGCRGDFFHIKNASFDIISTSYNALNTILSVSAGERGRISQKSHTHTPHSTDLLGVAIHNLLVGFRRVPAPAAQCSLCLNTSVTNSTSSRMEAKCWSIADWWLTSWMPSTVAQWVSRPSSGSVSGGREKGEFFDQQKQVNTKKNHGTHIDPFVYCGFFELACQHVVQLFS